MPANKNAMTRYKILDELLSDRYHFYTLDDLTREVSNRLSELYPETDGVVRRTIEKDIHYLECEGPFLADIERYNVQDFDKETQKTILKRCLRYTDTSFSIFKKAMSDDEEYLLNEALSLLGQFDGLPNLQTLEKLRIGLGLKRADKQIISLAKNPLENSNLIGELFTVISHHQVVELHYHKFSDSYGHLRINIYPYLLKEYNRRWFLFSRAESDRKLLCFSLDRIDKIVPLPSHRFVDYEGDINELFEDIIGITIYEGSPLYNIYFWVSDASKGYVETKPLHESQRHVDKVKIAEFREKYKLLVNGNFYRIDCKENYELIRELTSFGKDLLVLEPIYIRDKVLDYVRKMSQAYIDLLEE